MNNQTWMLLGGAALGASAMYLLDPRSGARRRRSDTADARKLQERVRRELGRVVSHPRAIDVYVAADGCVCLTGPVLMDEADRAIAAIQAVGGVREVDDRLERHSRNDGVPALRGGRVRPGRRSALLTDAWSPATKVLVCLGSTAAALVLGYVAMASGSGRESGLLDSVTAN